MASGTLDWLRCTGISDTVLPFLWRGAGMRALNDARYDALMMRRARHLPATAPQ
jgi:hypothetical protein